LAHPIKFGAVFVDELAAQTFIPFAPVSARNPPPRSSGKPVPLSCHVRVMRFLKVSSNEARSQPRSPPAAFRRFAPESQFPTLANTARSASRCQEQK
jgi:hypothetical protein